MLGLSCPPSPPGGAGEGQSPPRPTGVLGAVALPHRAQIQKARERGEFSFPKEEKMKDLKDKCLLVYG